MKSRITLLSFFIACMSSLTAQAPQGFQYQAVVRNGNGDPLLNTNVQFRFTVEHTSGNPIYYQETQSTITNALGGIHLVIGAGNGTQGNFETVNWKDGNVRVRVELDPTGGQNFAAFGSTNLQSVPYALYSDRAGVLIDGNGNDWTPEDDADEQTLAVNGNQLSISNGNAVVLPTGSGGDNWGTQTIVTEPELTGNGTLSSPLSIATQGATNGDVLKWNGNAWVPQEDNGQEYIPGDGISIVGGVISNTGDNDDDDQNEIQTLSLNGNNLTLSDGGGTVNLPITNYTEGTGIDINGSTIAATNTQAMWNANQLQGRNVSSTAPISGQALKYNGTDWVPGNDNAIIYSGGTGITVSGSVINAETTSALWNANKLHGRNIYNQAPADDQVLKYNATLSHWYPAPDENPWNSTGSNIYYTNGNVGFGTTNPQSRIHVNGVDKIQMNDQTFGKWGSISIEFSSNLVPEMDDFRDLGVITRRWDDVYASNGTINTSDSRDKTNIQSISYGLDAVMKLRPVSFLWKNRPERGTKLGLIAQELETVIPEVVVNPARNPEYNSEPGVASELRLGVYYSDLIPVLIKAMQEQQVLIEELQSEVDDLKSRL